MRRECRERFPPPPRFSDPDMHHGTCVTHVPWCMSGSLTSSFLWNRWRGKRSRHSRRMRNPQLCVFGRRPMRTKIATPKWLYLTPTVSQPSERQAGWDSVGAGLSIIQISITYIIYFRAAGIVHNIILQVRTMILGTFYYLMAHNCCIMRRNE